MVVLYDYNDYMVMHNALFSRKMIPDNDDAAV